MDKDRDKDEGEGRISSLLSLYVSTQPSKRMKWWIRCRLNTHVLPNTPFDDNPDHDELDEGRLRRGWGEK